MLTNSFFKILSVLTSVGVMTFGSISAAAKSSTNTKPALDLKEHGADLPEIGSSLFDKIFSESTADGKRIYKLPFPIGKFVDQLQAATKIESLPNATILPFSRSLQRPGEVMDQPWEYPRLVFGIASGPDDFKQSQAVGNKIFIGYNEKKDQMEVISFNDEAGRFEFQLVHDYSSAAKVAYSPRGKCLSCHQNQAPIFSINSWADAIHPMNQDSFGIAFLLAQPDVVKTKLNMDPHDFQTKGLNFPKAIYRANFDNAIMQLDTQIRQANSIYTAQRVWLHGCRQNSLCRQALLFKNFVPEIFNSPDFTQQPVIASLEKIKTEIKRNLRKYNYAEDELTNRDPGVIKNYNLVAKSIGGTEDFFQDIKNKSLYPQISDWLKSDGLVASLIKGLSDLNGEDNPATPRIQSGESYINNAISNVFNRFGLVRFDHFGTLSTDKRFSIVQTIIEKHPEFFNESAFNIFRFEILVQQIAPDLQIQKWVKLNFQHGNHTLLAEENIRTMFSTPAMNKMWTHCSACHSGTAKFPPPFLHGDEQIVTGHLRTFRDKIIKRITDGENNGMPPARHLREVLTGSGDKDEILKFIKSL